MSPPWRGGQRLSPPVRQALRFGLREGSGEPPSGLGRAVQCGVMGRRGVLPLLEEQRFFFASVTVCGCFSMWWKYSLFLKIFRWWAPWLEHLFRTFPRWKRLCYSMWLFHLHSAVKNTVFFPVFPLSGSTTKYFLLSICILKKNINHFLWHSLGNILPAAGNRRSLWRYKHHLFGCLMPERVCLTL